MAHPLADSWEVRQIIYQKYYGEAKRGGIIWTMMDWAETQLNEDDYNTDEDYQLAVESLSENFEHREALEALLAFEVSIFVYRFLNGPWGEMVDFFKRQRNVHCNEYREKTGYQLEGNDLSILL